MTSEMKPMLFNGDMVRALLEDRKTVTRRVVKPQPKSKLAYVCMGHKHGTWRYPSADAWKCWEDESFRLPDSLSEEERNRRWTPPCNTGDILHVRETWQHGFAGTYLYKASAGHDLFMTADGELVSDIPWRPSIHMPREAARIFLRVTGVRVERLHDMSRDDAVAEGCDPSLKDIAPDLGYYRIWRERESLWNSTIKPADRALYGWDANPWVWVIEFERVAKEAAMT